jgi:hypothetical protein
MHPSRATCRGVLRVWRMGVAMGGTVSPRQDVPPGPTGRSRSLIALLVVIVCVVAAIAVVSVLVTRNDHHAMAPSATPTPSVTTPSSVPSSAPQQSSTSSAPTPFRLGYQPLYPFASRAEAQTWQQPLRRAPALASGRQADRAGVHERIPRLHRARSRHEQRDRLTRRAGRGRLPRLERQPAYRSRPASGAVRH